MRVWWHTALNVSLMCMAVTSCAVADSWLEPQGRRVYSENKIYYCKVTPSPAAKYGRCRLALYKTNGSGGDLLWSRPAVNNRSPLRVYVGDSGKYVVTMDEWSHVGFLPVVVYQGDGELTGVLGLEDLLDSNELVRARRSGGSTWWNENCVVTFLAQDHLFLIRLSSGRELVIDLSLGKVIDPDEWREKQYEAARRSVKMALRKAILQMLESEVFEMREAGAIQAGQIGLIEAAGKLREFAECDETVIREGILLRERRYPVREAARAALARLGEDIASETSE